MYGIFKDSVSNITVKKTPPFRKPRIISNRSEGYSSTTALHHKKTRIRTERSGVRIPVGANDPDRLWVPPSPLFNELPKIFPVVKAAGA